MLKKLAFANAFFLAITAAGSAFAAPIFAPVGVSSPQGEFAGLPLANIINQSGLSAPYISGATDFASFTATTTAEGISNSGFTSANTTGPQQFTFDLGVLSLIDGVAIWNTSSVGAITGFELFADTDGDFSNGGLVSLLGPTALTASTAAAQPAQVFDLNATVTRFVHFNGLSTLQPPDFYGLNEVAFRVGSTAVVPVPAALPLMLSAFAVLGLVRRRRG